MLGFTLLRFPRLSFRFPRESGGPEAAVALLPLHGPQRSGYSAGRMLGFMPLSFPPQKRGPRNRDGAAATARTSAQRVLRRRGVRVSLKRRRPPCRGGRGGSMSFWLPARARCSLDLGVPRANEGWASPALSLRFPRAAGGPGAAA